MTLRLGVIRDFRAEQWPSMDLCADQLLTRLPGAVDLAPRYLRVAGQAPLLGHRASAVNADRLFNRHVTLPRFLRRHADCDFYHVVDHSYAHAVLSLPPGRAGVYCHDLDAFRSLLEPDKEPRPWWFRRLAARTLRGLRAAVTVFHSTKSVRERLLENRLVEQSRLVYAPYGVSVEFTPEAVGSVSLPAPGLPSSPFLVHVGSHIPRKRIDVLLSVFAAVRKQRPDVRLVQVGPPWTGANADTIHRLGLGEAVVQFTGITRRHLAELYRQAAMVLVPSETEGFGLPVIEALACGTAVLASDIPVLREVGGDAVTYLPVGDVMAWAAALVAALTDATVSPPRAARLARAARYTWDEHAQVIGDTYRALAEGGR